MTDKRGALRKWMNMRDEGEGGIKCNADITDIQDLRKMVVTSTKIA